MYYIEQFFLIGIGILVFLIAALIIYSMCINFSGFGAIFREDETDLEANSREHKRVSKMLYLCVGLLVAWILVSIVCVALFSYLVR